MTQPDEAQPIQHFFQWADRQLEHQRLDDSAERLELNPIKPIQAYFVNNKFEKLNDVLAALFRPQDPPDLAEVIVQRYTAVFSILLYIGKGTFIEHFAEHSSLDDGHLPLDPSSKPVFFPRSSGGDLFERFCRQQWRFCCPTFRQNHLNNEHFHEERILPILSKERLGQGGSAVLHKIRLYDEYNELLPENVKKKRSPQYANTFVLKTYVSQDAERNHKNEVTAFKRLGKTPHIIGYYGSYEHCDARHILLEYADRGDLEEYFMQVEPPSTGDGIFQFWTNILYLVAALMAIHAVKPQGTPDGPPIFQGLHQDVKPQNVLVVSNERDDPSDWSFKLGDLGLSHFEKLAALKGYTAIDTQGTRTYGAPECYRADEILATARLPVTPKADIWSLGCIYSEAARWVTTGRKGLLAYRQARLLETQQLPNFEDGNCFHDGQHPLQTIRDSHETTISNLNKDDNITQQILERLVGDMLQSEPDARPSTTQLQLRVSRVLNDARSDPRRGNSILSLSNRPPPPPEIPPSLQPILFHSQHHQTPPRYVPRLPSSPSEPSSFLRDTERSQSPTGISGHDLGWRRLQTPPSDSIDKNAAQKVQDSPADGVIPWKWQKFLGGDNVGGPAKVIEKDSPKASQPSRGKFFSSESLQENDKSAKTIRRTLSSSPTSFGFEQPPASMVSQKAEKDLSHSTLGVSQGDIQSAKEKYSGQSENLVHLPDILNDCVSKWCDGELLVHSTSSGRFASIEGTYILACPKLHPITHSNLKKLVDQDRHHTGLKELEDNQSWIAVNIYCHMCDTKRKNRVKSARQIEPLRYIATEIQKAQKSGTPMSKEPDEIEISKATSSSSNVSNFSSNAGPLASPMPDSQASSHDNQHSADSSSKLKIDKKIRPTYSFSADAWSLLFWARDAQILVVYDTKTQASKGFAATAVHLAAGGAKLYATVSKKGTIENVCIHEASKGALITSVLLETPVSSIAMSRNDRFLALGTVGKVLVYSTSNMQFWWAHELPSDSDVRLNCQRVWFSTDSEKVIAVTRDTNGDVYTYVNCCKRTTSDCNIPRINIPSKFHKDFGVSSVLYDNKFKYALVTAFTNRGPPVLFSLQDGLETVRLDRRDLGTQIQCATSPPDPHKPEFVLINGDNNIFSAHCPTDGLWEVRKLWKLGGSSIFTREELMAMAMPTQTTIYVFRIKGKQRLLTTILGDKLTTTDISNALPI